MNAVDADTAKAMIDSVPHWHHIMELPGGVTTPGAYDPRSIWLQMVLPPLHGKRVLDIGTRDGYYAFQCELRGATVLAVDHEPMHATGFGVARELLGCKTEYLQANVYDLAPSEIGYFDVVLFLGVLYHLRHPLLALDRIRTLCTELLVVESLTCDDLVFTGFDTGSPLRDIAPGLASLPIAEFLPVGRFHGDPTNKWVPNVACLTALIEDAGFTTEPARTWERRALVHASPIESAPGMIWAARDSGTPGA